MFSQPYVLGLNRYCCHYCPTWENSNVILGKYQMGSSTRSWYSHSISPNLFSVTAYLNFNFLLSGNKRNLDICHVLLNVFTYLFPCLFTRLNELFRFTVSLSGEDICRSLRITFSLLEMMLYTGNMS